MYIFIFSRPISACDVLFTLDGYVVNKDAYLCYLEKSECLHQPPHFILEGKDDRCSSFLWRVLLAVFFNFFEGRLI